MTRCSITNLGSCLPQKLYEVFVDMINAPIGLLLGKMKEFLIEPITLTTFAPLWGVIIYVLSLFYGLLMLYSGFNFIISGYDAEKRAKAKEWFKNVFIMIILIQASYFIYEVVIDINSLLTTGIMNMVPNSFFLVQPTSINNLGFDFISGIFYSITLFITADLLVMRYLVVTSGVIFIPLGIFFYFIPSLNNYGRLIINFLGISIFVTFIDAIIFLVGSKILELSSFSGEGVLIMISTLTLANIMMFYLMFFSAIKSAFRTGGKVVKVVNKIN